MRRGQRKKRFLDPFNAHVGVRLSDAQLRTLQMFVERFNLLHEGEAIRLAIDDYMAKRLAESTAVKPTVRPQQSQRFQTPIAPPEIDLTDVKGPGMPHPSVSIPAPELNEFNEEKSTWDKMRDARAKPATVTEGRHSRSVAQD